MARLNLWCLFTWCSSFFFFFAGYSSIVDVQSAKCFPVYSVCQNRCHILVPFIVSSMHSFTFFSPQISSDFDVQPARRFNISLIFGVYVSTLRADGPNCCCEIDQDVVQSADNEQSKLRCCRRIFRHNFFVVLLVFLAWECRI